MDGPIKYVSLADSALRFARQYSVIQSDDVRGAEDMSTVKNDESMSQSSSIVHRAGAHSVSEAAGSSPIWPYL